MASTGASVPGAKPPADAERPPSEWWIRARAIASEVRYRLRPAGRAAAAVLRQIAPYVSRALLLAVRIPAGLVAVLLDLTQDLLAWIRGRANAISAWVRPAGAVATVAALAAVALGVSQFVDYRGVAVGAPSYEGEVGTVAPAPLTELRTTGSAHAYLLLPVALAALLLVGATLRGSWRLGRLIAALGAVGIAVSIAIDAPAGLDVGRAGIAYSGAEAKLIEGFWVQLSAAATLVLCGPLLGAYARRARPERGRPRDAAARGSEAQPGRERDGGGTPRLSGLEGWR